MKKLLENLSEILLGPLIVLLIFFVLSFLFFGLSGIVNLLDWIIGLSVMYFLFFLFIWPIFKYYLDSNKKKIITIIGVVPYEVIILTLGFMCLLLFSVGFIAILAISPGTLIFSYLNLNPQVLD